MILDLDIQPNQLIARIPFMKSFKNYSDGKKVHLTKFDSNQNKKIMVGDDIFTFEQVNSILDFYYMREQINDNFFFHFNVKSQIVFTQPKNMDDLMFKILLIVNNKTNEKFSLYKEIISKQEHLTPEQINQIVNEINGIFFKIEDYFNNVSFNIKNPLNENIVKILTKIELNNLLK